MSSLIKQLGIRADSKRAHIIKMLQRKRGATVNEIAEEIGWLPVTVRGMFSNTLTTKLGLKLESEHVESRGRGRVYRIVSA